MMKCDLRERGYDFKYKWACLTKITAIKLEEMTNKTLKHIKERGWKEKYIEQEN